MNQSIGSEYGNVKFDYVNSEYQSSMTVRKSTKIRNDRLQSEVFGNIDNTKLMEGQAYCFSAAKLKQFVELKRQTEETNYWDLYNHVWSHQKLNDNPYDRCIDKYMEYILRISTTADDIVNSNLLAAVLAKKAFSNRKLAKLLSSTVAAMKHRWIWEDSPRWAQQSEKRGRTEEIGKEFQEISPLECTVNEQRRAKARSSTGIEFSSSSSGIEFSPSERGGLTTEAQNRKRRLCRHFLKGFCKRGNTCDFLHDSSIFCPDLQKVFLGGLPSHITESSLRQKMAEQGFNVINKPKVLRGFTPQVCLGSVEEAQLLIKKGKLVIDGAQVDVRPYEAFVKDTPEKKLPDDTKRSVFLGGLPIGTTGKDIKEELKKLDVKVVNHPLIKTGFTPQVMLGNAEQAEKLVNLKKVRIKNTLVDVRSYVNSRMGSNRSGKN